jgi:hypothetical protein
MKKTAIEWFFDNLEKNEENTSKYYYLYKKAIEIEKEQIIDAYKSGINCISDADADFYYTINYKSFYPEK